MMINTVDLPANFDISLVEKQADLICASYEKLLEHPLIDVDDPSQRLLALFSSELVVLSHGIEDDPIFNFANQRAIELFGYDWPTFIQTPSRLSAEPMEQAEREHLLNCVNSQGFIDDYSGVRVTSTGQRFEIQDAIVWNLVDDNGVYRGQAAVFDEWTYL